jgi:hypothetical protein
LERILTYTRFVDCEKWRAEYAGVGVEELVRTFDYTERPEVFKYYPQYYHKTDKVCSFYLSSKQVQT